MDDWYDEGDDRSRRIILRTLALLPHPRLHARLARRAIHSGIAVVFDAICYDNPFPATYFDDDARRLWISPVGPQQPVQQPVGFVVIALA